MDHRSDLFYFGVKSRLVRSLLFRFGFNSSPTTQIGYLLKSPTEALDEGNLLDPQLALGVITKALNARVTFLARAVSAETIPEQLANFDQAIASYSDS